jgi:hypothetical protein
MYKHSTAVQTLRGRWQMKRSTPLSQYQIGRFKKAGENFSGEARQLQIAKAVLDAVPNQGEVTVYDVTGTQQYFRIGQGRHYGIDGVHVHMPYFPWDESKGPTKAGGKKQVAALVGDTRLKGTPYMYVDELLRALEDGRYTPELQENRDKYNAKSEKKNESGNKRD